MTVLPAEWLDQMDVVSVDSHESYRSALTNPHPRTGAPSPLAATTMVVDPFHIVRLANAAVTKCRTRVQRETLEHRGWKGDPLDDIRKLLLMGAERVDDRGWECIHAALDAGDPDDVLAAAWTGKEKVRDIYLTDDPDEAAAELDDAIAWCSDPDSGPELVTLLKTLRRWRIEIVNHHRTGAPNGPVEAANLLIKQIKRHGRGFQNLKELPAPHPPRRRLTPARDSPGHETPTTPSQLSRVGPVITTLQELPAVGGRIGRNIDVFVNGGAHHTHDEIIGAVGTIHLHGHPDRPCAGHRRRAPHPQTLARPQHRRSAQPLRHHRQRHRPTSQRRRHRTGQHRGRLRNPDASPATSPAGTVTEFRLATGRAGSKTGRLWIDVEVWQQDPLLLDSGAPIGHVGHLVFRRNHGNRSGYYVDASEIATPVFGGPLDRNIHQERDRAPSLPLMPAGNPSCRSWAVS